MTIFVLNGEDPTVLSDHNLVANLTGYSRLLIDRAFDHRMAENLKEFDAHVQELSRRLLALRNYASFSQKVDQVENRG